MPAANVKPIDRAKLHGQMVTDADAFTALRYLRHREAVPALPEMEEQGNESLPGFEASLSDLYYSLWEPEPKLKEEIPSDRRYWKTLLGQTLQSASYAELHGMTQLKDLSSILGTIAMGESVLTLIPEEDKEKLQELSAAQQSADDLQQQTDQAQAAAQAAQMLADAASGSSGICDDAPTQGQLTAAEAQTIANELAKQAAEAKANAQNLRQQAKEANAKAEQLADDLLGKPGSQEAEQKLRELTRLGLQAVKDAQAKVQEISDTLESWGLEEAELFQQGIPESLALLERMKRNASLKKFAELLGRIRKIAGRKARQKTKAEGVKITRTEYGKDLKRAQRSELVALSNPALRPKALKRWTAGELRLLGQQAKQKLGHGPVIICEDSSGSMDGEKQQWAKATVLSLAYFAQLQKRGFGWIMFDSRVRKAKHYPNGQVSAKDKLEIVESRSGGGTDFEKPLKEAIEMIKQQGLKKADICFITDGECAVSDQFLKEFSEAKKSLEINIFAVLCDVGSTSDATIRKFSDRVEKVSQFSADEAATKVFSHL